MLRTRALKAILPIGWRLFRRSSQSLARTLRCSHAHIFSTGLFDPARGTGAMDCMAFANLPRLTSQHIATPLCKRLPTMARPTRRVSGTDNVAARKKLTPSMPMERSLRSFAFVRRSTAFCKLQSFVLPCCAALPLLSAGKPLAALTPENLAHRGLLQIHTLVGQEFLLKRCCCARGTPS